MDETVGNGTRKEGETTSSGKGPLRAIPSEEIFRNGERRVVIRHNRREYVLLVTKLGKLLLNRLN